MNQHILSTGPAGFISGNLTDEMTRCGYRIRTFLDNLYPQFHGSARTAIYALPAKDEPFDLSVLEAARLRCMYIRVGRYSQLAGNLGRYSRVCQSLPK